MNLCKVFAAECMKVNNNTKMLNEKVNAKEQKENKLKTCRVFYDSLKALSGIYCVLSFLSKVTLSQCLKVPSSHIRVTKNCVHQGSPRREYHCMHSWARNDYILNWKTVF